MEKVERERVKQNYASECQDGPISVVCLDAKDFESLLADSERCERLEGALKEVFQIVSDQPAYDDTGVLGWWAAVWDILEDALEVPDEE